MLSEFRFLNFLSHVCLCTEHKYLKYVHNHLAAYHRSLRVSEGSQNPEINHFLFNRNVTYFFLTYRLSALTQILRVPALQRLTAIRLALIVITLHGSAANEALFTLTGVKREYIVRKWRKFLIVCPHAYIFL